MATRHRRTRPRGAALLDHRCAAALELVGLADRARAKPATFSGGIKRRLDIVCALVHDPDLPILDEPTAGVDPQSRNAIFDNLEELRRRGKALVYTTHYMEEVERLCDRIVIVDHGRVIASDTLAGLRRMLPSARDRRVEVAVTAQADRAYNRFAHAFAGMGVQFVLFMGIELGMAVLLMRRQSIWKRLRAARGARRRALSLPGL